MNAQDVLTLYETEDIVDYYDTRPILINSKSTLGDTPLHIAVIRNAEDEVAALINGGADVNATGEIGKTPLHYAVGHNNMHIIRLLCDAGARIDINDEFGLTPYSKATQLNLITIVEYFKQLKKEM